MSWPRSPPRPGYDLVQRLTAQPQYVLAGAPVDRSAGARHVDALADPDTGLAAEVNSAWVAVAGAGRGHRIAGPARPAYRDRHRGPADRHPQRSRCRLRRLGVVPREGAGAGGAGLRRASTPMCARRCGRRSATRPACSDDEYWRWPTADGPALDALCALADDCAATWSATM